MKINAVNIKKFIRKSAALLTALCLVFSLAACGEKSNNSPAPGGNNTAGGGNSSPLPDNPSAPSNTNTQEPEVSDPKVLYDRLAAAAEALSSAGSGRLKVTVTTDTAFTFPDYSVSSNTTVEYRTLDFAREDGGFGFVRLFSYTSEDDFEEGQLQHGGLLTSYYKEIYDDGAVLWKEGPAFRNHTELPAGESLIMNIPDYYSVKSISFDGSRYSLALNQGFYMDLSMPMDAERTPDMYNAAVYYYVDSEGRLTKCSFVYDDNPEGLSENLSSAPGMHQSITVEFVSPASDFSSDWFAKNSDYVRPEYNDVTETQKELFVNIPEKAIFDVRIPRLKDGIPGSESINRHIASDLDYFITTTEESLSAERFEDYVRISADYSVFRFKSCYEIVVEISSGAAYGSGSSVSVCKYIYDANGGCELTPEEFLDKMGYSREDFIKAAKEQLGCAEQDDAAFLAEYPYDMLLTCYYFDADSLLCIVIDEFV